MDFDFDSAESSGPRYENGKRYQLTINEAEEGESKNKGTPYLRLKLRDELGNDAYAVDIWNTPKALYRAVDWFKALGLKDSGMVSVDPGRLRGIKFTAVCKHETYQDLNGKDRVAVRWESPEMISYGRGGEETMPGDRRVDEPPMTSEKAAKTMAPKGQKRAPASDTEVPF